MRTDKYHTNDRHTDIQTGNLTPRPIGDLSSSKLTVFTIVLAGRYLGGSWRPIFEYERVGRVDPHLEVGPHQDHRCDIEVAAKWIFCQESHSFP